LAATLVQTREAFTYFNNHCDGFAPRNALRLHEPPQEDLT
jgi:uncharacterized protein YecE (DUF72 family)